MLVKIVCVYSDRNDIMLLSCINVVSYTLTGYRLPPDTLTCRQVKLFGMLDICLESFT